MNTQTKSLVAVLMFLFLGACTYEPTYTQLACNVDQDCSDGATCQAGVCIVGDQADMSVDMPPGDDSMPPTIDRIAISPGDSDVVVGNELQLVATVFDSDDVAVPDVTVVWTSSDDAFVTVSSSGLVTALAEGSAEITASVDSVSASVTIRGVAPAATVMIEPSMPDPLPRGRSLTLTARAFDADGNELTDRAATWSSSDANTVEITEEGVAIGLLVGSATITADIEGITDSVDVTVEENDVARVEISPDEPTVLLNEIKVFDAIIYDAEDEILDPRNRTFAWGNSNGAVVSLSRLPDDPEWSQRLQGTSVGMSTLSVEVDGMAALSDDLAIEVVLPTVDSVTILDPQIVPIGPPVQLETLVEDPNGVAIVGRPHTWSSSDEAVATIDATTGELTPVAPGTTTITVDVDGVIATRDVDVRFLLDQISVGEEHTCGTSPDNLVFCWGSNGSSQLGIGPGPGSATPAQVLANFTYTEVHAGGRVTCAVESAGAVHCWGAAGLTGAANGTPSNAPRAVFGGRTYTTVAVGSSHACAIEDTGDVWCWGQNGRGQLGDNSNTNRDAPVQVQFNPAGNPIALALGNEHSCVLTDTPKIWCWGRGQGGALGNDDDSDQDTPVEVMSNENFVEIGAGRQLTCGRTNGDAVYCWGINADGQLGIGDLATTSADTPQLLPGVAMSAIGIGLEHGCGLDAANGEVQCWGNASNFRLGNADDQNDADAPVANAANLLGIAVASGSAHSCALAQDNQVYCWGHNGSGRAGTSADDPIQMPTPVWPAP